MNGKEQRPGKPDGALLPEAPASANTRVRTTNGFDWQVTLRAEDGEALVKKIEGFEVFCAKKIWTPAGYGFRNGNGNGETNGQSVEKKENGGLPEMEMCPTHNVRSYLRNGKFGQFYSHKDGGGWCNRSVKKAE